MCLNAWVYIIIYLNILFDCTNKKFSLAFFMQVNMQPGLLIAG